MIHEIGVELAANIQGKGCPFDVYDGPELRPTTTSARERIVIEHDPNGDGFTPPGGNTHRPGTNPRTLMSRVIGVKITIYAQNPAKGSIYWEHVRRAEQVIDMVLCGLYQVVKARANILVIKSGKFIYPEDLQKSETFGGAVYELLFTVDRGVFDVKWSGAAIPTVGVTSGFVQSTTNATGPQGTETACGSGGT